MPSTPGFFSWLCVHAFLAAISARPEMQLQCHGKMNEVRLRHMRRLAACCKLHHGCIGAAGERPVKEASFVGNGNHSRFMFLTECDFLVSVSGEITVVPGGTCAHVNTRIPGLLINGIRPVLASFALRCKQAEFSGLRLQKKKHNKAVHCERSRETGLSSLDALKKKEKIAQKCK